MSILSYQIQFEDNLPTISGNRELKEGANIITERLPDGVLRKVTAVMHLSTAAQDRIFMNGFQT